MSRENELRRVTCRPKRVSMGTLAEDYDGIGQYVMVTVAGSSVASAYKARVAAGDFGGGRRIPKGTRVPLTTVRGRMEVLLGNHPGDCIDPFSRSVDPADVGVGTLSLPVELLVQGEIQIKSANPFAELDLVVNGPPDQPTSTQYANCGVFAIETTNDVWELNFYAQSTFGGDISNQPVPGVPTKSGADVTFDVMIRFLVESTGMKIKVWEVGDTEPSGWADEVSWSPIAFTPDSVGMIYYAQPACRLRVESFECVGFGTDDFTRTESGQFGTGVLGAWDDDFGTDYGIDGSTAGTDGSSNTGQAWVHPTGGPVGVDEGGFGIGPLGEWETLFYNSLIGTPYVTNGHGILLQQGWVGLPVRTWVTGGGVNPAEKEIELLVKFRPERSNPSATPGGLEDMWTFDLGVSEQLDYDGNWAGGALAWNGPSNFYVVNVDDNRGGIDNFEHTPPTLPAGGGWDVEWLMRLLVDADGTYMRVWPFNEPEPKTNAAIGSSFATPTRGGRGEAWNSFETLALVPTPEVHNYTTILIDGSSNTIFHIDYLRIVKPCKRGKSLP